MNKRDKQTGQESFDLRHGPNINAVREAFVFRVMADRASLSANCTDVAFALATMINAVDGSWAPAQAALAATTKLGIRTVRRALADLRARGHIVAVGRKAAGGSVCWRMARADEPLQNVAVSAAAESPKDVLKQASEGHQEHLTTRDNTPPNVVRSDRINAVRSDRTERSDLTGGPVRSDRTHIRKTSPLTSPLTSPSAGIGEQADGVSDRIDFARTFDAEVAYQARRLREFTWRGLLRHDAVVQHADASSVHQLIEDGYATEAEVLAEIEALTRSSFRPKWWAGVAKFVRDEIAKRRSSQPRPSAGPSASATDRVMIMGEWRTVADCERAVARYEASGVWDSAFGGEPGTDGFMLPDRFDLPPHRLPRLDKRAG